MPLASPHTTPHTHPPTRLPIHYPFSRENIQDASHEFNRAGKLLFSDTDIYMAYPLWLKRQAQGHFDDLPFRAQGRNLPTGLVLLGADEHTHDHGMRIFAMAPHLRKAEIKKLIRERFPDGKPA